MPLYSCNTIRFSGQILLYETSNIIEMHIMNKPICAGWNSGRAIEGIQNSTGTIGFSVPGRNATAWSTTNDAWRFTPNGLNNYVVTPISFFPAYLSNTPATYTWYQLPSNSFIQTGMPLVVNPTQTTSYKIESTTSCLNAIFSDTVTVTVNNSIIINASASVVGGNAGQDITICNGGITTLTSGGGGSGATYSWSPSSYLMTPNDSTTISAPNTTTQYIVTVTNAAGCIGTDTINIAVTNIPVVSISPSNPTICVGQITSLTATGAATYTWSPNIGLNTTSGPTVLANPLTTTTYTVTGISPGCGPVEGYVTVQVNIPPIITFNPTNPLTLCQGNTSPINIISSDLNTIFNWAPTTGLNTTVGGSVVFNGTTTQTYTVSANTNGCMVTPTYTVNVNPLPVVTWPTPWVLSYCQSDPQFTLFGGSGTPSGGTGFYTGLGVVSGTNYNPYLVNAPAGTGVTDTVHYIYTDLNGCTDSVYNVYVVTGNPIVDVTSGPPVCYNNGPVILNGTPSGGTFTGSGVVGSNFVPTLLNGIPSNGGNFIIHYDYIDPISGCTGVDSIQQTVLPLPQPQITNLINQYCIDAVPVRLTGLPDPTSPIGGYFTVDNFVSTMVNPSLTGTGIHHVTYIFTSPNGCTDSTSQDVLINPLPIVNFSGLDSTYCQYDPITNLIGSPSGPIGVFSGNGVSGTSFNPGGSIAGMNAITYTYTNPSTGCTNYITHTTLVIKTPVADFDIDELQVTEENPTFHLEDVSLFANSLVWTFGDEAFGYSQNITHTYADTGSYMITLIVSNEGCLDTTQTEVRVSPSFLFFIPNAFTPNNDGTNDDFQIQGVGVSEFSMLIFDRWGNAVFQSNDINIPWNGSGTSQGIYIYRITVTDYTGRIYQYNGYLSVIR